MDNYEVTERFAHMQQVIASEGEQTRRHVDAMVERLEQRIRLIGEHCESLKTESRVAGADSRVVAVEKVQKVVLTEVRGLATKIDRLLRARARDVRVPGP